MKPLILFRNRITVNTRVTCDDKKTMHGHLVLFSCQSCQNILSSYLTCFLRQSYNSKKQNKTKQFFLSKVSFPHEWNCQKRWFLDGLYNIIHMWPHHSNAYCHCGYPKMLENNKSIVQLYSCAFQGQKIEEKKSRKMKVNPQYSLNTHESWLSLRNLCLHIKIIKHLDFDESISTHVDHTSYSWFTNLMYSIAYMT